MGRRHWRQRNVPRIRRRPDLVPGTTDDQVPTSGGRKGARARRRIGKLTAVPRHRIFAMEFAKVYPLYVQKAERKQRTKAEVDDPLMRQIRYLDKLIDELAKGKAMERILRQ